MHLQVKVSSQTGVNKKQARFARERSNFVVQKIGVMQVEIYSSSPESV